MREQSGYELLGVSEDASFEEIQQARTRLMEAHKDDRAQMDVIEAAYDTVLMERLRLRQEGKIPVPDRIRFPERQVVEPIANVEPMAVSQAPDWLRGWLDTPSRSDIVWPGGVLLVTGLIGIGAPPVALALGIGASIYFLTRKERRFGRAVLLSFVGFFVGVLVGSGLGSVFAVQLGLVGLSPEFLTMVVTLAVLWVVSSFLR